MRGAKRRSAAPCLRRRARNTNVVIPKAHASQRQSPLQRTEVLRYLETLRAELPPTPVACINASSSSSLLLRAPELVRAHLASISAPNPASLPTAWTKSFAHSLAFETSAAFRDALSPTDSGVVDVHSLLQRACCRALQSSLSSDETRSLLSVNDPRKHISELLLQLRNEDVGQSNTQLRNDLRTLARSHQPCFLAFILTEALALCATVNLALAVSHGSVFLASIRAEADAIVSISDSNRTLPTLNVARACALEAVRLYPLDLLEEKMMSSKCSYHGVTVNAGDMVTCSPYLLHRSEDAFDKTDAFLPSRWLCTGSEALESLFPVATTMDELALSRVVVEQLVPALVASVACEYEIQSSSDADFTGKIALQPLNKLRLAEGALFRLNPVAKRVSLVMEGTDDHVGCNHVNTSAPEPVSRPIAETEHATAQSRNKAGLHHMDMLVRRQRHQPFDGKLNPQQSDREDCAETTNVFHPDYHAHLNENDDCAYAAHPLDELNTDKADASTRNDANEDTHAPMHAVDAIETVTASHSFDKENGAPDSETIDDKEEATKSSRSANTLLSDAFDGIPTNGHATSKKGSVSDGVLSKASAAMSGMPSEQLQSKQSLEPKQHSSSVDVGHHLALNMRCANGVPSDGKDDPITRTSSSTSADEWEGKTSHQWKGEKLNGGALSLQSSPSVLSNASPSAPRRQGAAAASSSRARDRENGCSALAEMHHMSTVNPYELGSAMSTVQVPFETPMEASPAMPLNSEDNAATEEADSKWRSGSFTNLSGIAAKRKGKLALAITSGCLTLAIGLSAIAYYVLNGSIALPAPSQLLRRAGPSQAKKSSLPSGMVVAYKASGERLDPGSNPARHSDAKPQEPFARVTHVAEGSPAEHAGLKRGDKIVRVGDASGKSVTLEEFASVLAKNEDSRLPVELKRGKEERRVIIVMPRCWSQSGEGGLLGCDVRKLQRK